MMPAKKMSNDEGVEENIAISRKKLSKYKKQDRRYSDPKARNG